MQNFTEVVRVLNTAAFGTLALLALHQRKPTAQRSGSDAAFWLVAVLGDLAVVSAIGVFWHPTTVHGTVGVWAVKVIVAAVLVAPWLLYRFMAAFDPPTQRLERIVDAWTLLVVVATFGLPRIPKPSEHPAWLLPYLWFAVGSWSYTSLVVAIRLWRAGKGQPAVSRRRMRMLSVGATVLIIAALPGTVPATSQPDALKVVTSVLPLLAALAFYLAFSPPAWLRVVWRWPDQPLMRRAELNLIVGSNPDDLANQLLARTTELLGGRGSFLSSIPALPANSDATASSDATATGEATTGPNPRSSVFAVHGMSVEEAEEALSAISAAGVRSAASFVAPDLLAMPLGAGWLGVRSSPYAPYFGEDEVYMLQGLGSFAELVFQRLELFERERRARLDLERANNELGTLVYGVSHDLKSPLITVLGYLEYLRMDFAEALGRDGRHYVDRMEASARYMQDLISDLLELSRIGRIDVETQAVDLNVLVRDLAAEVGVAHPAATLSVSPLPVVRANPARARQLFVNLLENAVRHGGRDDLTVRVTSQPLPGGGCRVLVSDDGVGISRDYHSRVFGIFERLEPRHGDGGGTGIGLAICRKIVEQLDGEINLGDPPAGTEVRITLPPSAIVALSGGGTRLLEPQP